MPDPDPFLPANPSPLGWQQVARSLFLAVTILIGVLVTALIADHGTPLHVAVCVGLIAARWFWAEMTLRDSRGCPEHAAMDVYDAYSCPVDGCSVEVTDLPGAGPNPALADFAVNHSLHSRS